MNLRAAEAVKKMLCRVDTSRCSNVTSRAVLPRGTARPQVRGPAPWRLLRHVACAASVVALMAGSALPTGAASAAPHPPSAPAVKDPSVTAIEEFSFSALITSLSAGPRSGDLALGFANGSGAVILNGAETVRLPVQTQITPAPQWVPASDWVLYARRVAKAGGASGVRWYIVPAGGGSATALPACATTASVAADAVAWWCGDRLSYLPLPAGATVSVSAAQSYTVTAVGGSPPDAFAVDPQIARLAFGTPGGVTLMPLTGTVFEEGSIGGGSLNASWKISWSAANVLESSSASSVTLTTLGSKVYYAETFPATDVEATQWLPGGKSMLIADRANPGVLPAVETVDTLGANGTLVRRMAGSMGYILGFSADGSLMWREEGFAPGVFASGAAGAGKGPFQLQAVPVSQGELTGPQPKAGLVGGAVGSLNLSSFHMVSPASGWATDGVRIYHTARGGAAWTDVTPEVTLLGSDSWRVEPIDARSALAITTLWTGAYPAPVDTVFLTTDAGQTWRRVPTPFPAFTAYALTATDPQHLWSWSSTVSGTTIYASADGGAHWSPLSPQGMPAGTLAGLTFRDPEDGWASGHAPVGAGGTVWFAVTHDGGQTWQRSVLPPVPDCAVG